ncbi:MAG: hypothetical protein WC849_02440 [Candidatus Paceibacterota bacterium]
MAEKETITLSFKNATNVLLPKKVADELEGTKLEVSHHYSDVSVFILSSLVSNDSVIALNIKEEKFQIRKFELLDKLEKKGFDFSKRWIEENIPGNYILITNDCVLQ